MKLAVSRHSHVILNELCVSDQPSDQILHSELLLYLRRKACLPATRIIRWYVRIEIHIKSCQGSQLCLGSVFDLLFFPLSAHIIRPEPMRPERRFLPNHQMSNKIRFSKSLNVHRSSQNEPGYFLLHEIRTMTATPIIDPHDILQFLKKPP